MRLYGTVPWPDDAADELEFQPRRRAGHVVARAAHIRVSFRGEHGKRLQAQLRSAVEHPHHSFVGEQGAERSKLVERKHQARWGAHAATRFQLIGEIRQLLPAASASTRVRPLPISLGLQGFQLELQPYLPQGVEDLKPRPALQVAGVSENAVQLLEGVQHEGAAVLRQEVEEAVGSADQRAAHPAALPRKRGSFASQRLHRHGEQFLRVRLRVHVRVRVHALLISPRIGVPAGAGRAVAGVGIEVPLRKRVGIGAVPHRHAHLAQRLCHRFQAALETQHAQHVHVPLQRSHRQVDHNRRLGRH
eukprot:scaffold7356_cov249-Pinguiococcus_pyrenoidosus.AAC.10